MNSQVYWPGALAFATTATIVGKESRLLIGLWLLFQSGFVLMVGVLVCFEVVTCCLLVRY